MLLGCINIQYSLIKYSYSTSSISFCKRFIHSFWLSALISPSKRLTLRSLQLYVLPCFYFTHPVIWRFTDYPAAPHLPFCIVFTCTILLLILSPHQLYVASSCPSFLLSIFFSHIFQCFHFSFFTASSNVDFFPSLASLPAPIFPFLWHSIDHYSLSLSFSLSFSLTDYYPYPSHFMLLDLGVCFLFWFFFTLDWPYEE